MALKNSKQWRF